MQISQTIKDKRKELDLTQEQLAEKLYVTPQAVSKWENDTSTPDITILNDLSKILGVTIDELINGVKEEKKKEEKKAQWGNLVGVVSKDVHGDIKNILGDVQADIYGNVTGNIVGTCQNIYGNVEGNITGEVMGDITGYVGGSLRGTVYGSVKQGVRGRIWGAIIKDGINVEKVDKRVIKNKKRISRRFGTKTKEPSEG